MGAEGKGDVCPTLKCRLKFKTQKNATSVFGINFRADAADGHVVTVRKKLTFMFLVFKFANGSHGNFYSWHRGIKKIEGKEAIQLLGM